MSSVADQRPSITDAETRTVSVSFVGKLDTNETLTGVPTVTEVGSSDLTITNIMVNVTELVINDETVAVGKAVKFLIAGAVKGKIYEMRVVCGSTSSPAQTLEGVIRVVAEWL